MTILGYAIHCLLFQVTNSHLIRETVIGKVLKDRKLRTYCI